MKHFVFTGATSGMGLVSARALAARDKSFKIIVGARTPGTAVNLRQAIPDEQLLVLQLDTSSLSSVKTFGSDVTNELKGASIAGLALNAGAQFVSETALSEDGYDLTFATNVLGHMALYNALAANMTSNTCLLYTSPSPRDA